MAWSIELSSGEIQTGDRLTFFSSLVEDSSELGSWKDLHIARIYYLYILSVY